MKTLFLAGIAALFLATGAAHAQEWPVTTGVENLAAMITFSTICRYLVLIQNFQNGT
jgi:hypothetical protein